MEWPKVVLENNCSEKFTKILRRALVRYSIFMKYGSVTGDFAEFLPRFFEL